MSEWIPSSNIDAFSNYRKLTRGWNEDWDEKNVDGLASKSSKKVSFGQPLLDEVDHCRY